MPLVSIRCYWNGERDVLASRARVACSFVEAAWIIRKLCCSAFLVDARSIVLRRQQGTFSLLVFFSIVPGAVLGGVVFDAVGGAGGARRADRQPQVIAAVRHGTV